MLLKHLSESTDPIYKIWANQAPSLERLAASLKNDDLSMLSGMVQRAVQKHASDPLQLLPLLNPLVKMAKTIPAAGEWAYKKWLNDFLNALAAEFVKLKEPQLKLIKSKVDLGVIGPYLTNEYRVKLQLSTNKASRSSKERQFDDENELFIFIGRPGFVESPPGSDNFKKTLEIERLVKVDRHDPAAHAMAHQMKLRARFQGENSEVYMINLPKGLVKDEDHPDEWIVDLINTHKQKV